MVSLQRSLSSPASAFYGSSFPSSSPPTASTHNLSGSSTSLVLPKNQEKYEANHVGLLSPAQLVSPDIFLSDESAMSLHTRRRGSNGNTSTNLPSTLLASAAPSANGDDVSPASAPSGCFFPGQQVETQASSFPRDTRNYERPQTLLGAQLPSTPPPHAADMRDRPYQFPSKPLLQDASLFSNTHVTAHVTAAPESEGTSLNELAHLVRLSKFQERKRANTRMRLQLNLIATALSARMVRCGTMAHRNLTECLRSDNRTTFAGLYEAVHNIRRSCEELRKYALLEPELDALRSPASTESLDTATGAGAFSSSFPAFASAVPFLNEISAEARDSLVTFLTAIRTNPDFLATRLSCLTTSELGALTLFYQGMDPFESALSLPSRQSPGRMSPSGRASSHGSVGGGSASGGKVKDGNPVLKLWSFQRHDPLSTLIHTCFANSAGPDSAEDRRRTDIWATACARLVSEKGAAGEPVLLAVLNAWSAMREWSGCSNMEWYLMKILEDGAFLLDRAEDQNGTRFNLNEWTSKDQVAAEQFYERAIDDLFEVIDDEDATGIPEGFIELGTQILKKLDAKFIENTRAWLVNRWLFGTWLMSVVIRPETHGLMAEYHITEYGRQKILKEVALRAQRIVMEKTMPFSHHKTTAKPTVTPPATNAHIENILRRFDSSHTKRPAPRLLPARSITSLRETAEVHPYLVVSPADLATMVHALFPDRRPHSTYSSSIPSGPGSVSGFSGSSQPIFVGMQRNGTGQDTPSVFSTSASSANSTATTSVEPLLESQPTGSSATRYSPPPSTSSAQDQRRPNHYDDDGYRVQSAVQEMIHNLGHDVVLGSCHPCAERWAVLFISPDGNDLSPHMSYDPDENDHEDDTNSSSIDTDEVDSDSEDDHADLSELNTDYHQLRDAILKLVEDYEIPVELEAKEGRRAYSNRANRLKKYRLKSNKSVTVTAASSRRPTESLSRNPYWKHMQADDAGAKKGDHHDSRARGQYSSQHIGAADTADTKSTEEPASTESVLISMLAAASSQSRAQSDFLAAHQYWKTIQQLNSLGSDSLRRNGFAALLNIFARGPRDSIRRSAAAVEEYDAWLVWLRQSQERTEGLIETMMRRLQALRDKMWYVTDVRSSAPYEFSRNIAVALKTMGAARKWSAYQRSRQSKSRGPAAAYLLRPESELVELLAATEDQGGPNKLSDDQAEKTVRWLEQYGIENFCQGEERIHRFSCEISSCIDKLVGESIVDAPVLWSSDLYTRDRRHLETSRRSTRDRDSAGPFWDDASSIRTFDSDSRQYETPGRRGMNGSSMRSDFRAALGQKNSPGLQFFDSSRYGFPKSGASLADVLDAGDYFSGSPLSQLPPVDTSATFWSPFQVAMSPSSASSYAPSPTASTTNLSGSFSGSFSHLRLHSRSSLYSIPDSSGGGTRTPSIVSSSGRPGTSASSVDTVFQQRLSEEKARFLADLRQTLTSLLLSDLGNLVFARGSETDAWFGKLGQECIDRREAMERKQRQESSVDKNQQPTPQHRNSNPVGTKVETGAPRTQPAGELLSNPLPASQDSHQHREGQESSRGTDRTRYDHTANSDPTTSSTTAGGRKRASTETGTGTGTSTGLGTGSGGGGRSKPGTADFPFKKAYQRLLRMFCVHPNPYAKLGALVELENLIAASLSSRSTRRRLTLATKSGASPVISRANVAGHVTSQATPAEEVAGINFAASRARPLEEAIDNIKGRRSSILTSSRFTPALSQAGATRTSSGAFSAALNKDAISRVLQALFRDPAVRPKTLFRDLQFIASFVPSELLDRTERGKSFWDAGLAALLLKREVCMTMIEVADEVVGHYTQTRKAAPATAAAPTSASSATSGDSVSTPTTSPSAGPGLAPAVTMYTLADAAQMWTITAKEGDPTSQRELALFYMMNPELVERATLPLSKPREVFKKSLLDRFGGSGSGIGGGGGSGGSGSGGSSGGGTSSTGSSGRHHGGGLGGGGMLGRGASSSSSGGHGASGGGSGSGGGGSNGSGGSGGLGGGTGTSKGGGGVGGVADVRSDPALMCVAIHWMEAAEQGGDELARTFLGQNEMMTGSK